MSYGFGFRVEGFGFGLPAGRPSPGRPKPFDFHRFWSHLGHLSNGGNLGASAALNPKKKYFGWLLAMRPEGGMVVRIERKRN